MIFAIFFFDDEVNIWLNQLNMLKILFQNTALSVQIFEWLCLYNMVSF